MTLLLALLIGVVAGLRTMTAAAAVSLAACFGWIDLSGTWLAFLGSGIAAAILAILALAEFVTDQLPSTPSRKVPVQFGARIVIGALAGYALGRLDGGSGALAAFAGIVGAVVGTLAGAEARGRLAAAFGSDRPAAILEDVVAILLALITMSAA
jgi:uncharacterized membrane protein